MQIIDNRCFHLCRHSFFNNPLVAEASLRVSKMLGGVHHVVVEIRRKVVISVLGDVVPFGLGFRGSHDKLVGVGGLTDLNASLGGDHVGIGAVVRDWVVDGIAERCFLVGILVAASRRADRVRLRVDLNESVFTNNPVVAERLLSVIQVALGVLNVAVKRQSVRVLGDILGFWHPFPFVAEHLFGDSETLLRGDDVLLASTEVRNKVVHGVIISLRMKVLRATSGAADRVGIKLH